MKDTSFSVPEAKLPRLASCYRADRQSRALTLFDGSGDSRWALPLPFPSAGGGFR
jgi:hypothetical protein